MFLILVSLLLSFNLHAGNRTTCIIDVTEKEKTLSTSITMDKEVQYESKIFDTQCNKADFYKTRGSFNIKSGAIEFIGVGIENINKNALVKMYGADVAKLKNGITQFGRKKNKIKIELKNCSSEDPELYILLYIIDKWCYQAD